jgi:predicted component of type VI protein secretion system
MKFRLVTHKGGKRAAFDLEGPQAVLGRGPGNAVRIPSLEVSRRHCRLIAKDGVVTVEDLDSVNGTFLNGRRLKQPQVAHPGDKLQIGPVTFTIEYQPRSRRNDQHSDDLVNPADLLHALADGELVDVDDLDDIEPLDDVEVVEPVDLDALVPPHDEPVKPKKKPKSVKPKKEAEPAPLNMDEPIKPDFDFDAESWQLPEGGDLRDILSQIENSPPPPPPPSSKKKKK